MKILDRLPKALSRTKKGSRPAAPEVVIRDPLPLPGNLLSRLNALRRKYWVVGVGTGVAMLAAATSLLLIAQGLCDWWFDLPWLARAGFLLGDLIVLGTIWRRHLSGARVRRPTLPAAALMVERKWPRLAQSVIAAVELTQGRPYSTRGSNRLVDVMLQQAKARTTNLNFGDVVPTRALRRWLLLGGAAVLAALVIAAAAWPASKTLLERIALLNVPLPTKTIVVPITRDVVVPVGSDVELSARAEGIVPSHGRVTVIYAASAPQDFPVEIAPDKPGTFSFTLRNVQSAFKYSFHLGDGNGPEFSVEAKVPPSLTSVACEQLYPDYTGLPARKLAPTELTLLAGSHLKVHAEATDRLKSATLFLRGAPNVITATIDASGTNLEADLPIPAKNLTGFSIHLVDQAGVSSTNETVYPIILVPDAAPEARISEPVEERETITPQAQPVILFSASDDYGLAQLNFNYQIATPAIAGQTSPAVQSMPVKIHADKKDTRYEFPLNVAAQTPAWQEGMTIDYWIEARDNNTATGPGMTSTEHKHFVILSIEAKQAEILQRLKENAAQIDKLSDTQQKINGEVSRAIPQN